MPVLQIEALPQPFSLDLPALLSRLCVEVAASVQLAPHHVWATWRTVDPGCYVEGATGAAGQPPNTHPPLVTMTAFEGRTEAEIEAMIQTTARVLAAELSIEAGNVFIVYNEARAGRTFTGGAIVRRSTYQRDPG